MIQRCTPLFCFILLWPLLYRFLVSWFSGIGEGWVIGGTVQYTWVLPCSAFTLNGSRAPEWCIVLHSVLCPVRTTVLWGWRQQWLA